MNRRNLYLFVAFLLIMAAGLSVLLRARTSFAMGNPGVRLAEFPLYDEETNRVADTTVFLPELPQCFSKPLNVFKQELMILPKDTTYGRRYYRAPDGFEALTQVVLMGSDRTSIHKPQYCLTGQGYAIESSEVVKIPMSKPVPYELEAMKMVAAISYPTGDGKFVTRKAIYLYWFVADGKLTPHHGTRMWWMAKDLLSKGVLQRWAYIGILSQCAPGTEDQLFNRMKEFVAELVPHFQIPPSATESATAELLLDREFASIPSTP